MSLISVEIEQTSSIQGCCHIFKHGSQKCNKPVDKDGRCKFHHIFRYKFTIDPKLSDYVCEIAEWVASREDQMQNLRIDPEHCSYSDIFLQFAHNQDKIIDYEPDEVVKSESIPTLKIELPILREISRDTQVIRL